METTCFKERITNKEEIMYTTPEQKKEMAKFFENKPIYLTIV
jgi:hypothetical protein